MSRKHTIIANVEKKQRTCNYFDGSVVNGRRQCILFSFIISAPPGFTPFKEPTTILFENVNEENIDDKTFRLEDNKGKIVDFILEFLTFTVMLLKL